jgi:hypothetical protein
MTLGEAIEELIRQYDKACGMIGISQPVTVALREAFFVALDEDEAEEAKRDAKR